ncbi:hypothetical protein GE21DRAFT_1273897 [Neurospora crassa]|nr:hypothetical protein GE21DRAFT_1273897 [Neurospora crassa]
MPEVGGTLEEMFEDMCVELRKLKKVFKEETRPRRKTLRTINNNNDDFDDNNEFKEEFIAETPPCASAVVKRRAVLFVAVVGGEEEEDNNEEGLREEEEDDEEEEGMFIIGNKIKGLVSTPDDYTYSGIINVEIDKIIEDEEVLYIRLLEVKDPKYTSLLNLGINFEGDALRNETDKLCCIDFDNSKELGKFYIEVAYKGKGKAVGIGCRKVMLDFYDDLLKYEEFADVRPYCYTLKRRIEEDVAANLVRTKIRRKAPPAGPNPNGDDNDDSNTLYIDIG